MYAVKAGYHLLPLYRQKKVSHLSDWYRGRSIVFVGKQPSSHQFEETGEVCSFPLEVSSMCFEGCWIQSSWTLKGSMEQ